MGKDLTNHSSIPAAISVSGRRFEADEIALVRDLADRFRELSRNELALTVCELLGWHRPSGRLKNRECLDLFDLLEEAGVCRFPPTKRTRPRGTSPQSAAVSELFHEDEICGALKSLLPVTLEQVRRPDRHRLWRELVGRFHYLGFKTAFGASMRFLITDRSGRNLGCLQYSSPAWRMKVRDEWIGWSDDVRRANLQRIVGQSRFLILPWVRVPNLSSHVLAKSVRQLPEIWRSQFGVTPLLVETLVDASRYRGTCYRAANWIYVGETTGRGRMDREHKRHGAEVKRLFVYPLVSDVKTRLMCVDAPACAGDSVLQQRPR
jgi:hypothetical protein